MAYASVETVRALNAHRTAYSTTTKPSLEQVQGFVDDIAGEIDTALAAQGIATPVTSPAAFVSALTRLNGYGAAALAEMAQFPEADRGQGSSPQGDRYWAMYQQGLKSLKDGTSIHPDAPTLASSSILARSYGTDNPDSSTGLPPAPVFSKRQVF